LCKFLRERIDSRGKVVNLHCLCPQASVGEGFGTHIGKATLDDSAIMLNQVITNTQSFVNSITREERKKYGQFFTSELSAEYMASLFDVDQSRKKLRILDAGAGTGILSVALVERLRTVGYQGEISLTCYETDEKVIPLLAANLYQLRETYGAEYDIRRQNYITSQSFYIQPYLAMEGEGYDLVIGNPPYMKLPKEAPEAQVMQEVCHGAPNMYFLFMAMGVYNLSWGGELVYIVPRSWTSGAYFEAFRRYLFDRCAIEQIHLFESRDKVFDSEPVLQETMIIKVRNTEKRPDKVIVTSSTTSDFMNIEKFTPSYHTIVGKNGYVYLVTNSYQENVLSRMGKLGHTLPSVNLKMCTGLIVDYRTTEELRDEYEEGACPLFYSCHIKEGRIRWPQGKAGEYILTDKAGHLQRNTNYLFVKRLTSKEEHRRLQCAVYLSTDYPQYRHISTQNKVNYIECESEEVVYGLYALFSSSLYDEYYRILNGSTQVNSTEMNHVPVPSKDIIRAMGSEIRQLELTEENCNKIVDKWIK